tara:strand:- start:65 stop:466 length:402 start_codon:yes stop_codon:yes gene_type:complete
MSDCSPTSDSQILEWVREYLVLKDGSWYLATKAREPEERSRFVIIAEVTTEVTRAHVELIATQDMPLRVVNVVAPELSRLGLITARDKDEILDCLVVCGWNSEELDVWDTVTQDVINAERAKKREDAAKATNA